MSLLNKKHIHELRLLEHKLKMMYHEYKSFKRIYESSNNKKSKSDDKKLVITSDNENDIFSDISTDIIRYFKENEYFVENIVDPKTREIKINNYFEVIQAIQILIDILEFGLLTNNFTDFFNPQPSRN